MDAASRRKLFAELGPQLPPNFEVDPGPFSNSILYRRPHETTGRRIMTFVGPRRHIVVFVEHGTSFFVNAHGELVRFLPWRVHQVYQEEANNLRGQQVGWERAVGAWLATRCARQYTGLGWVPHLCYDVLNILQRLRDGPPVSLEDLQP